MEIRGLHLAQDERERLRMFCEDRGEHAWDNASELAWSHTTQVPVIQPSGALPSTRHPPGIGGRRQRTFTQRDFWGVRDISIV